MANTETALPEQTRPLPRRDPHVIADFQVSELAANRAGAMSPFGETDFPLPVDSIRYTHPSPENRPNLAGGLQ